MAVRRLGNQSARNDAGMILRSFDRDSMRLEYRGRTLPVLVDRAPGSYGVWLRAQPVWDDGTVVDAAELLEVRAAIVEILEDWNIRTEFMDG